MTLTWDNAKVWQDNANMGKDVYAEPEWRFDCNFKLDFDGALLRISSRFYPPHYNIGDWWEGNVSVLFLDKEILRKYFKCDTLDELKSEVEKFTSDYGKTISNLIGKGE